LNDLVPSFEKLEIRFKSVRTNILDSHLLMKMDRLLPEISMIFRNRSMVMLKGGNPHKAILDAQESLKYDETAKVYNTHAYL